VFKKQETGHKGRFRYLLLKEIPFPDRAGEGEATTLDPWIMATY
jgi:hypothetical protein